MHPLAFRRPLRGPVAMGLLAAVLAAPGLAQVPVRPAVPAHTPVSPPPSADAPLPEANRRIDERRSEQPFTVDLFDRPVALRLGYELSVERRRNFDLNRARDRDRRTRDQELKADARFSPLADVTVFAQAVALSEVRHQPATGVVTREEGLQRGELWVRIDRLFGSRWSLQAGRIPLVERRTFWWDEDIDALRVMTGGENWRFETGVGRELARKASFDPGIDPKHRGVRRWFGQAAWTWASRQALELFWLHADDRSGVPAAGSGWREADADGADARLTWLGLRASGSGRGAGGARWAYWVDVAGVAGRETLTPFRAASGDLRVAGESRTRRVRGQAFDLGVQGSWAGATRPTLTLAWAAGSGSAPGAPVDRNFRQTGLQENKARLSGVKRLQRYGELFDPELSNLRVATAGFGLRLAENTSVELVAHQFRQVVASPQIADTRLSQAPAGTSPRLGREFDLFFAWRESRHLEITFLVARFLPGAAYAPDRRDAATGIELGLALNY